MSEKIRTIEVRPFRGNCWKVFEAPGVEPFFLNREQAIGYAKQRATSGRVEIRILDRTGQVVERIGP